MSLGENEVSRTAGEQYVEVAPSLWIAASGPPGNPAPLPPEVEAVVTLASRIPPVGSLVKELRFGFPDAVLDPDVAEELERLADWAFIEWKAGEATVIRCQAGLNRSGLLCGLVLLRDGVAVQEIINRIRRLRGPFALSNESFIRYLEGHPRARSNRRR
jgi:hypothetical protein